MQLPQLQQLWCSVKQHYILANRFAANMCASCTISTSWYNTIVGLPHTCPAEFALLLLLVLLQTQVPVDAGGGPEAHFLALPGLC